MNEQNSLMQHAFERAGFAAILCNIVNSEREMTHDEIKFHICTAFGRMIEDGNVVGDMIDSTLAEACKNHAEMHNAMVEVNRMLSGE
jgi:hypothetical protein